MNLILMSSPPTIAKEDSVYSLGNVNSAFFFAVSLSCSMSEMQTCRDIYQKI